MSKAAELAALIGGQKALGHKNLVKNGAMVVAQRATSASGNTAGGIKTVDRMNPEISSAGTWTHSQSTEVPSGQGFVNSFKLDCTTADASLSAGDVCILGYRFEGLELQRLNYGTSGAKNIVLSFWVKTNKTGNYVVNFQNIVTGGTNRTCGKVYTVSQANTWQKVEFPIAADTVAGIDNDNALTAIMYWWLASGTTYTSGTLSNTWENTTNANVAAGLNVNLADSTDNEWYITGIQLEEGDVATSFEHEDFGTTLAKCQRYFTIEKAGTGGEYKRLALGQCQGSTSAGFIMSLSTPLRGTPTLVTSGNSNHYQTYSAGAVDTLTGILLTSDSDAGTYNNHIAFNVTVSSGLVAGDGTELVTNNNASYYLAFDAEL